MKIHFELIRCTHLGLCGQLYKARTLQLNRQSIPKAFLRSGKIVPTSKCSRICETNLNKNGVHCVCDFVCYRRCGEKRDFKPVE